ncbi:ead/Ea22-like family protein [Enterobacter ludwigii]|uniref:ead/Ea22-like family protein n=1 Tax=Enterobacter ludwigii TaxID=299767 RepID=UPI0032AF755E
MSVNRYEWVACDEHSCHCDVVESAEGDMVDYEDYAALEQRLIESERYGRQTDITIDNLEMKLAQMAAENAGMNTFVDALLSIAWQGGSADGADIQDLALKHGLLRQEVYSADEHETLVDDPGNFEDGDPVYFRVETPATDAFLAEVRAQAHKEGAYFVANRMLAAWESGFIEDTAKNAADIARMILTSTEFMANAPEGDFDRSFADGVLEDIAAHLRQGGAE